MIEENVFSQVENIDNVIAQKRAINKIFRENDESHLWPIRNKFNVTEKAIKQSQIFQRKSDSYLTGLEYIYFLSEAISKIVNDEENY